MIRRRTATALRLLLGALSAGLLWSCSAGQSELDRVTPPVRFADLRESAAWTAGFDPAWWRAIDTAYAAYDASIDGELIAKWDAFAADVAEERVRGQSPDAARARRHLSLRREIDRALGDREAAFIASLEKSLPKEAAPFIALVGARAAFQRAGGMLREPAQRLPGPLEVMQLCGRRPLDGTQVELATAAYQRLAALAADTARVRAQRFVSLCVDLEPVEQAVREGEFAERTAAEGADDAVRNAARTARERAQQVRDGLVKSYETETARGLERLRLALLREDREFAQAFNDQGSVEGLVPDYLEQVDFALHDGVRAAPGIRAFARIGRRALERKYPGDAAILAEFDATVARELGQQAALRPALASGSSDARRKAYEALQKVGDPIGAFLDEKLKAEGGLWRVLERTVDVMAGVQSADDAAAAVLAPPAAILAEPPGFTAPGRDRNVQVLFGCPLEPMVFMSLGMRLGLDEARAAEGRAFYEREVEELDRLGDAVAAEVRRDFESLGARDGTPAARAVDRFMSRLAGHIARLGELDRAANERVLAESARLAGIAADDERLRIARIELALLAEVGLTRDAREAEPFCGVIDVALASPFEIVRQVGRTEGERAAAEEIIAAHGDELLAAHRAMQATMRRNLRGFLVAAIELSSAIQASRGWRPEVAGAEAAAVRIRIAAELRAALGDEFGDRYDEAVIRRAAPACEPRRPAAYLALQALAQGTRAGDLAPDERAVVSQLLTQAAERRRDALHDFIAWRAGWVRIGEFGTRESWNELERVSPRGWLIRARMADADARAVAACEALLSGGDAAAAPLPGPAIEMPRRLKPYFE